MNNLLPLSVSVECLDSGLVKNDLVRHEAILNITDKRWSSFLCILGLSSVLRRNIYTYYPDSGEFRNKLLFNQFVQPRENAKRTENDIHILFCHEGILRPEEAFKPNHFVPLLFHVSAQKRKIVVGAAKDSTVTKKAKPLAPISKPIVSKPFKPTNILNFFTVAETPKTHHSKPVPIVKKAPNETFCSAAQLASYEVDSNAPSSSGVKAPSASTSTSSKLPMPVESVKTPHKNFTPAAPHHSYDVAFYRKLVKGTDDSEICNLIKNVFTPDANYVFPKNDQTGRSFRYPWLNLHSWLCYSPSQDGAFCLSCVLFGNQFQNKAFQIGKFFSEPYKHWNNATSAFNRHGSGGNKSLHACTFPLLTKARAEMSGANVPDIAIMINENLKEEVLENRKKLAPIVDTVIYCARSGLPLRGHRDDSKYHPEVGSYSSGGVGNFIEALNFRVRGGDKVLEDHLKTCGKNRTYISKTSQNKLIKCCGEVITDKIINDVKESKFFTIIADEAADASHKEQMSLVLRFVDSEMNVREEFISFLQCKWGLTGANLAKLILEALDTLTLSIENCRGQGYDGAGAVAGQINGLAAHILRINPKALFIHCFSHRLNLSVCDSLGIIEIKNMLKHVNEVSHFIRISQTRNMPFEENIKAHSSDTESRKAKLVDVCRTRWVERVEGLDTFQELFVPLFHTLDDMVNARGENFNPSRASDALTHLTRISKFDFIVALVITRHVLDITLPVIQLLQGKSIDIMDGTHLINSLKKELILIRNSVDTYHDIWYEEALQLASKIGVEESKSRTLISGRQTTRANPPFTSVSEHFKRSITIPLIDHFNSSLQARFDLDTVNVYKGLCIIPEKMLSLSRKGAEWKEEFKSVASFYYDDLPNPVALDAELSLWHTYWESYIGPCPSNIIATLKSVNFVGFENIKIILRILGTLPITSCECERSISALRTLKDYKRSTMVEERLNGLAMMKIHQEIVPNVEKVIDKFATGNTRLNFSL